MITIERLPSGLHNPLPAYQTPGAAGMDLYAALDTEGRSVAILPGERRVVPTGIRLEMPRDYEAQIRPRSGLAARNGVTVLNSPGTIDSDYRGEVAVILVNHGLEPFMVTHGDRIAQLVFAKVERPEIHEAGITTQTSRGSGGFGSTGT